MYSAEGNVIDYNTGAKRCAIPTQEEIERSDSLREEAWGEIKELLKKELSEEAMTELKAAFYTASREYLFVGKKKQPVGAISRDMIEIAGSCTLEWGMAFFFAISL